MEDNIGAEQYVAAYKKIREAIKEKESAFKQEIADLKEKQQILSTKLLEFCNEHNLDSIKTSEGTVSRRVITKFWCSDWDQMHTFIKENDAMHLLEARLHQANLKQFLQDNPDKMPIGLQSNSEYAVSVRKRN